VDSGGCELHTGLTLELDALDALDIPRSAGIFGFPFTADTPLAAKFPLARLASLALDACELVRCRLLLRCAAAKPYTPSSSSESVKSDSVRHGGERGAYEKGNVSGGGEDTRIRTHERNGRKVEEGSIAVSSHEQWVYGRGKRPL
jgi:hypothetical protein